MIAQQQHVICNVFHCYAWADWKPHGDDKMRSPGGRVLSKATFERLSRGGKESGSAPAPKAAAPSPPPAPPPAHRPTAGYTLGQSEYRSLKAKLSRAINSKNPSQVRAAVAEALMTFESKGYPDDWHRWQRAADDIVFAQQRAGGPTISPPASKPATPAAPATPKPAGETPPSDAFRPLAASGVKIPRMMTKTLYKIQTKQMGARFAWPKMLNDTGWWTDTKVALALPPAELAEYKKLLATEGGLYEGRYPPIESFIPRKFSGADAVVVGFRQPSDKGEVSRVLLRDTATGDRAMIDVKYYGLVKSRYPNAVFRLSGKASEGKPVVVRDWKQDKVVGLIMPMDPEGADYAPVSEFSDRNLFEVFAWSDWKPHGPDKMRSPGGRVLSRATFERLSTSSGKGKATAPKPASTPPATQTTGRQAVRETLGLPSDPAAMTIRQAADTLRMSGRGQVVLAGSSAGAIRVRRPDGTVERLTAEQIKAEAAGRPPAPPAEPRRIVVDPRAEYHRLDGEYRAAVGRFDAAKKAGDAAGIEAARGQITDAIVARAEIAKKLPNPPAATQFELDRIRKVIEAKDGRRPAGILHAAAWALAKAAPLLAGAGGAGVGAGVGGALGSLAGPVGTGIGAAAGTLIGGFLGGKVGKYSGSPRRFMAGVRRLARQTLPAAAGTAGAIAGLPVAGLAAAGVATTPVPMLIMNAAAGGLFDSYFDLLGAMFTAPAKLARAVYRGTAGLVEPSAAKGRRLDDRPASLPRMMAEERDLVGEVRAMLQQAGVSPLPSDDAIRFAVGAAALAEDGWFDGDEHEAFMWQPQKTRRGGAKAVWTGTGQREPLYGQDAINALAAQERKAKRVEAVKGGVKKVAGAVKAGATKVVAAAKKADSAVGKAAGKAGEKFQVKRRAVGGKLKEMALNTEGTLGTLVKWLAESQVGAQMAVELERRAERVDATAKDMADKGYLKGQVEGGKRAFRYLAAKFSANRRRYGLIPALGIEAAAFMIAKGIPTALTLGTAAAGAALGTSLGGLGVGAGAMGGMLLGGAIAKRFLRLALGPVYTHLGRATAETVAAKVARRVRPASPARERKRAGAVKDLAPAVAMAEAGGQPTILDLVRAVKMTLATRCRLAGVECPPVSDGQILRSLGTAFDAIRGAGGGNSAAA